MNMKTIKICNCSMCPYFVISQVKCLSMRHDVDDYIYLCGLHDKVLLDDEYVRDIPKYCKVEEEG